MVSRHFCSSGFALALLLMLPFGEGTADAGQSHVPGIISIKSIYSMDTTVARLRRAITVRGITLFLHLDQGTLAREAGQPLHPSVLLVFGNPALSARYVGANPISGLEWPVRLLVHSDREGVVWVTYTDFRWIEQRYGIANQRIVFATASRVLAELITGIEKAN